MEIMNGILFNFIVGRPRLAAVITMILISGFAWLVVEVIFGWSPK